MNFQLRSRITPLSLLLILLLILSCRESGSSSQEDITEVIFKPDTTDSGGIFIRDWTGKEWDVTHAVEKYGFEAERFRHGLGPYAIQPILNPELISTEDPRFNDIDGENLVIGTVINGSARAYPLSVLRSHEIVNEKFYRTHVAVGY
jgi:hypothetical protein